MLQSESEEFISSDDMVFKGINSLPELLIAIRIINNVFDEIHSLNSQSVCDIEYENTCN